MSGEFHQEFSAFRMKFESIIGTLAALIFILLSFVFIFAPKAI